MEPQNPQQVPPPSPYPTQPSPTIGLPIAPPKREGPPLVFFIIPIIVLLLLLIGALVFGFWAYGERNDYRDNVNAKANQAVKAAEQEQRSKLEVEFLEREKSPYRHYNSPAEFGAVDITYPKTWSAAVDETASGSTPLDGYFHPSYVPGARSGTAFALRLEVIERTYDKVLGSYESSAKSGKVRISPYVAPKVPEELGARVDGEVVRGYEGSAVLFPLRDKTIRISTLSPQFVPDFDNIILPNLVFTP